MIVGDLADAATVFGVHGTTGESGWKCFARGAALTGGWEAIEWARLPPGGISGEHLHTRTEEAYIILTGLGRILLDGVPTDVSPGDVVLTGLGTKHGLHNIGDEDLTWLVIEITGPATAGVLHGASPAPQGTAARLTGEESA